MVRVDQRQWDIIKENDTMTNDDDKNNKKHNKVQSDRSKIKLKKMLQQLKQSSSEPKEPKEPHILNLIQNQSKPKRKKYSAEIIQLNSKGDIDLTQSDLYWDIQDEAWENGYTQAMEDLKKDLDAAKKEAEHYRRLVKSISAIVHIEV